MCLYGNSLSRAAQRPTCITVGLLESGTDKVRFLRRSLSSGGLHTTNPRLLPEGTLLDLHSVDLAVDNPSYSDFDLAAFTQHGRRQQRKSVRLVINPRQDHSTGTPLLPLFSASWCIPPRMATRSSTVPAECRPETRCPLDGGQMAAPYCMKSRHQPDHLVRSLLFFAYAC